jgi:hypothetical protein
MSAKPRERQIVLAMPAVRGGPEEAAAAALDDKAASRGLPSVVLEVAPGATPPPGSLGALGTASRLYLVGTGGHGPEDLAALLAGAGLREAGLVSLVADAAAAPADATEDTSYAARLHAALRSHGIAVELAARTGEVVVVTEGEDRGRKRTRPAGGMSWASTRPRSKVVYGWRDAEQTRRWSEDD